MYKKHCIVLVACGRPLIPKSEDFIGDRPVLNVKRVAVVPQHIGAVELEHNSGAILSDDVGHVLLPAAVELGSDQVTQFTEKVAVHSLKGSGALQLQPRLGVHLSHVRLLARCS